MRNAGTQLRSRNAALIPHAGIVLGAIDPAIMLLWAQTQKETRHKAGQSTSMLTSGVDAVMYVVNKAYR